MNWNDSLGILAKIKELQEVTDKGNREIDAIRAKLKEVHLIHDRYEAWFGSKYGTKRAKVNRKIDRVELERMMHLIRAEASQPQKTGLFGIGGMKREEYLMITDKLNLIASNLNFWEQEWNDFLQSKVMELKALLDQQKVDYQSYSELFHDVLQQKEYQSVEVPSSLNIGIGEVVLPIPEVPYISEMLNKSEYPFCNMHEVRLLLNTELNAWNPCVLYYSNNNQLENIHAWLRNFYKQVISTIPMYEYEFFFFDTFHSGGGLQELLELQNVRELYAKNLVPQLSQDGFKMLRVLRESENVRNELQRLEVHMAKVTDLLHGKNNFYEYNQENERKIPCRFVVVEDPGRDFNEVLLRKLLLHGARCGIFTIIVQSTENAVIKWGELGTDVTLQEVYVNSDSVVIKTPQNEMLQVRPFWGIYDQTQFAENLIGSLKSKTVQDNSFDCCFPEEYPYGTYQSTIIKPEGHPEGKIVIPFAVNKWGEIVSVELGSADYAHGLVSGSTGSGKSTMLHMLINSVVMNYHPKDVEIWLVDYKKVEMSVYINDCPPHVKFIGIERNEEFTFSLIDLITAEYERRLELFHQNNVRTIDLYKQKFGMNSLPRILLIIDEFHVMSQQVRESEGYARKLENLLAEGRGAGIVCLFADQSISVGLNGLTEKGKNQMRMRLAMANTKDEMKVALDISNLSDQEASMQKGEVRIKRVEERLNEEGELERVPVLELNKVIYLTDDSREEIAKKTKELYGKRQDTIIIDGNKEVVFDQGQARDYEQIVADGRETYYLHLGKPSTFETCYAIPLTRNFGNNLISIHERYDLQKRILISVISSFLRLEQYKICVLADDNDELYCQARGELEKISSEHSQVIVVTNYKQICSTILELEEELVTRRTCQKKETVMVFWLGLENMLQEFSYYNELPKEKAATRNNSNDKMQMMQDSIDSKFADLFAIEMPLVAKQEEAEPALLFNATRQMKNLLKEGPKRGVFQFVFFSSILSLKFARDLKLEDFKYKISGYLPKENCFEYYGTAKFMSSMDQEQSNSLMVCYDGVKARFFLPYLLK